MSGVASPFLKWAGGKGQLLAQFAPLYPAGHPIRRYHEPFVGAGAVFFDVRDRLRPEEVFLSDTNDELVNVWKCLQKNADDVIELLELHKQKHSREHFYEVRARVPGKFEFVERAARLIYLNRTCFNGLYRVNSKGIFNVPLGRYKNPRIVDAENLRAVSAALRGAQIDRAPFRDVLERAKSGDFVYFDPPYDPLTKTSSFTSYTEGSFGRADQEALAHVYRQLAKRGCLVMLSNSDTPLIRELYADFDVRKVNARRAINSRADKRGLVTEVVVLSYDPAAKAEPPARPKPRRALTDHARRTS